VETGLGIVYNGEAVEVLFAPWVTVSNPYEGIITSGAAQPKRSWIGMTLPLL
jgi:hypothetical protein